MSYVWLHVYILPFLGKTPNNISALILSLRPFCPSSSLSYPLTIAGLLPIEVIKSSSCCGALTALRLHASLQLTGTADLLLCSNNLDSV